MTGPGDRTEELHFWRRWRATSAASAAAPMPCCLRPMPRGGSTRPRPSRSRRGLPDHPEALDDIIAARQAALGAARRPHPRRLIARAAALVAGPSAAIVPFPVALAVRRRSWRDAAAWGAVAASLLATSIVRLRDRQQRLCQPDDAAAGRRREHGARAD